MTKGFLGADMFLSAPSRIRHAERSESRSRTAAIPLLLVSIVGMVTAGVVWAMRGWVDGLACYLLTILVLGVLLRLSMSGWLGASASRRGFAGRDSLEAADSAVTQRGHTGLSSAAPLVTAKTGLPRTGG